MPQSLCSPKHFGYIVVYLLTEGIDVLNKNSPTIVRHLTFVFLRRVHQQPIRNDDRISVRLT